VAPRRFGVAWTEIAESDLDEAISFLAAESRPAAVKLLERLLSAAASLAELPDRGRTVPELGDPRFRELILNPYRLIYFRTGEHVWIVAVISYSTGVPKAGGRPKSVTHPLTVR
jgi:toxin ParE1/3/4